MKKLISLLLVVMMLCSISTVAFADADSSITVKETDDKYIGNGVTSINTPKTEVWLQVDASGQIDVTVPLVLVFKTDIDGGDAQEATNYKITNNNNNNLVVTDVVTATVSTLEDTTIANPMSIVAYTVNPGENQYKVKLTASATVGTITEFDLAQASYTAPAKEGGLFALNRTANVTAATDTLITVDMVTGKLNFVTSRSDDDKTMNPDKGIHLLTVTYTVAVNTSGAIGDDITTSPVTSGKTFTETVTNKPVADDEGDEGAGGGEGA